MEENVRNKRAQMFVENMRQSTYDYVMLCDSCQRRKAGHEFQVPLRNIEECIQLFQVTGMYITGTYCLTPTPPKQVRVKTLDHFRECAETIRIRDKSAEICARVYATQIISRP
jgi:hypothetical protein